MLACVLFRLQQVLAAVGLHWNALDAAEAAAPPVAVARLAEESARKRRRLDPETAEHAADSAAAAPGQAAGLSRRPRRCLVVCPSTLVGHWCSEAAAFWRLEVLRPQAAPARVGRGDLKQGASCDPTGRSDEEDSESNGDDDGGGGKGAGSALGRPVALVGGPAARAALLASALASAPATADRAGQAGNQSSGGGRGRVVMVASYATLRQVSGAALASTGTRTILGEGWIVFLLGAALFTHLLLIF